SGDTFVTQVIFLAFSPFRFFADLLTADSLISIFKGEMLDSLELARQIADILAEKQAEDILILDLQALTPIADYFVICTGTSQRQLRALQQAIYEGLKQSPDRRLAAGVEGTPESGWLLMDYGTVIVHLFEAETRAYYRLEELWGAGRIVAKIQ
ncbi:MAG TPA: ribosome silencing factor, partial [Anaerolineae bacterium]|nr:ribosome silencing factor [Anaerolineae bacterium]